MSFAVCPRYFAVRCSQEDNDFAVFQNHILANPQDTLSIPTNLLRELEGDYTVGDQFDYFPENTSWQAGQFKRFNGATIRGARWKYVGLEIQLLGCAQSIGVPVLEIPFHVLPTHNLRRRGGRYLKYPGGGRRFAEVLAEGPTETAPGHMLPPPPAPEPLRLAPIQPWGVGYDNVYHPLPVAPAVPALPAHIQAIVLADAEQKGQMCPISQEKITARNGAVTSCGHVFDRAAIQQWLEMPNSNHCCAVCRTACVV